MAPLKMICNTSKLTRGCRMAGGRETRAGLKDSLNVVNDARPAKVSGLKDTMASLCVIRRDWRLARAEKRPGAGACKLGLLLRYKNLRETRSRNKPTGSCDKFSFSWSLKLRSSVKPASVSGCRLVRLLQRVMLSVLNCCRELKAPASISNKDGLSSITSACRPPNPSKTPVCRRESAALFCKYTNDSWGKLSNTRAGSCSSAWFW